MNANDNKVYVAALEAALKELNEKNPYPVNMLIDRKAFAAARVGYAAAIYNLEKFIEEKTEELI